MNKAAFLLVLLAFAPLAQAHGSPNPIEAEDLILEDERTDSGPGFFWSGFDMNYVHAREAFFGGHNGVVFRWFLWGGNVETELNHAVELTFDGIPAPLLWETVDNGATWTLASADSDSDSCKGAQTLEVERSLDAFSESAGPQSYDVQFQGFVPLCRLGLELGGSIDNMAAASYAGENLVDAAPGGFYNPNAPAVELVDPMNNEARGRLIDSLVLDGPDRYTQSNLTFADGILTVEVDNLIAVSGQHIFVKTNMEPDAPGHEHDESGNHLGGGKEAGPGEDVTFEVELESFDVIQVFVETDLGGRETFFVTSAGEVTDVSPQGFDPESVDTPSAPLAFVAIALLAFAMLRRR